MVLKKNSCVIGLIIIQKLLWVYSMLQYFADDFVEFYSLGLILNIILFQNLKILKIVFLGLTEIVWAWEVGSPLLTVIMSKVC